MIKYCTVYFCLSPPSVTKLRCNIESCPLKTTQLRYTQYWLNSETPIEEVPLLSPCPTPTTTTMLPQNSGYIATRNTKLVPQLNGDPRSKTQKPKSHATMNVKLLTLGPQIFYQTSMLNLESTPNT